MSKTPQQLWEAMENAEAAHTSAAELFLRVTGWNLSCQHPDSCWRWTKEFNGRPYSLGRDEAVSFETRVTGFFWPEIEG